MKHQVTTQYNAPWICAALWLLILSGCLDQASPERVVQGSITDLEDRPLAGAAVSVAGRVALTDDQGAFTLAGLPRDTTGPLHVTAQGYTAWTLDRAALSRLHARLRPIQGVAELQARAAPLTLHLRLPEPTQQPREVYLSLDGGEVVPVRLLPGGSGHSLQLSLTPGEHTLSAISPDPSQGDLASAPLAITVGAQGGELDISLRPTTARPLWLMPSSAQALELGGEVAITCQDAGDHTSLVSYGARREPDGRWRMSLFSVPSAGPCRLVSTWTLDEGRGSISHVAFVSLQAEALPEQVNLQVPPPWALHVEVDPIDGALSWARVEGASVYDVFVAPVDADGLLGPPVWSATTASTQARLPALPPDALERIAWSPGQDLAVRVVARFVPGLSLEENWDWSTYYGYISSPWELGGDSLTRPWGAPP